MCLVSLLCWRVSLGGGAPDHVPGSVWRHGRGQDRAMAPRLCRLTITSHLHTCQGSPGGHQGAPGGHQGGTRGHQGGTSQCTGQADTRLRRRTSAQERYLTPAPAECGGAAAGRAGRAPHSGQLTPAPELGWWRLVAGCCGARPAAAAACVTAQLTYIQDTHPAAAHPGPAQCGRNHPDHPAVADRDIFEIMNNDTIARRMSVRNILQHPS